VPATSWQFWKKEGIVPDAGREFNVAHSCPEILQALFNLQFALA